jgi:hypothetical protein
VSIQRDIIDTIGPEGLAVTALRAKMGNIGNNELDLAVRALMRGKRLRIVAVELTEGQYENHYELLPSKVPLGRMPNHPPPSAAEELAVNLRSPTRICITCARPPQPLCEFRLISRGERALVCNTCHGKKTAAGQPKHRGERATISVNGSGGVERDGGVKAPIGPSRSADTPPAAAFLTVNGSGNGQHGGSHAPSDSALASAAASSEVMFHSAQRNQADHASSGAGEKAPTPRRSLPNSLGIRDGTDSVNNGSVTTTGVPTLSVASSDSGIERVQTSVTQRGTLPQRGDDGHERDDKIGRGTQQNGGAGKCGAAPVEGGNSRRCREVGREILSVPAGQNADAVIFTHRDAVMNSPESGAEGSEVRDRNTSQRHGTGAVPQGDEAQATRHPAVPYDIDYSYSASFERPLIEYHDPVPVNVTLAPTVLERARAQREAALKRIAELEAELEKERKRAGECEVFFELYERFGETS